MIKPTQIEPVKGALVSVSTPIPTPKVITFQFNPETLSRTVNSNMFGGSGRQPGPPRFGGAPNESINLEIQLDATDEIAEGDAVASKVGIRPQLAALELLLYPSLAEVALNSGLLAGGAVEVLPFSAPRVLFTFGPGRVIPVRLNDISVTEEFFDAWLNPVRATLQLQMTTVSYSDVYPTDPTFYAYIAYQTTLEAYSAMYQVGEDLRLASNVASAL